MEFGFHGQVLDVCDALAVLRQSHEEFQCVQFRACIFQPNYFFGVDSERGRGQKKFQNREQMS